MKNNKKKGYALATVIILILVMTVTVTSAFTILMRYMFFARNNLQDIGEKTVYYDIIGEIYDDCI